MRQNDLQSLFGGLLNGILYLSPTLNTQVKGCDAIHGEHEIATPTK